MQQQDTTEGGNMKYCGAAPSSNYCLVLPWCDGETKALWSSFCMHNFFIHIWSDVWAAQWLTHLNSPQHVCTGSTRLGTVRLSTVRLSTVMFTLTWLPWRRQSFAGCSNYREVCEWTFALLIAVLASRAPMTKASVLRVASSGHTRCDFCSLLLI